MDAPVAGMGQRTPRAGRPGVGFAGSSAPDRVSAGSGDRTEGLATIQGEVLNGGLDVAEAPMEDDGERR